MWHNQKFRRTLMAPAVVLLAWHLTAATLCRIVQTNAAGDNAHASIDAGYQQGGCRIIEGSRSSTGVTFGRKLHSS